MFLIVPSINIILQVFIAAYPAVEARESYWESFLVFFMIACCSKPIQFFTRIRTQFLLDAKLFLSTRLKIESMNAAQYEEFIKETKY